MPEAVDQVLARLDEITEAGINAHSPSGYFPALYRRVTATVGNAIEHGKFEDKARMEALLVNFAQRYLDAYDAYTSKLPVTQSWLFAFSHSRETSLIVLQHLLLGMNAHISLDLGISTSEVADPTNPLSVKEDFLAINGILGSLINNTQKRLTRIFGPLGILDRLLGSIDESFSLFSIKYARGKAWTQTLELLLASKEQRPSLIEQRDARVAAFSHQIVRPPAFKLRLLLRLIRLAEKGNVPSRIRALTT